MRLISEKSRIGIYFIVLFTLLAGIYLPSFFNPPHVDYWEAFHIFHLVDASPAPPNLIAVVNHDPWQDGTYRPFSYLLLYLEHNIFGARFVWNHIVNFLLYCISVVLLYLLVRGLGLDKFLSAAFLGLYIFLFTHSGILTLTFHQFVIIGFSSFLLGFIIYLRWLTTARKHLLVPVGMLFLLGMFCYETFSLWPLSIIILHQLHRHRAPSSSISAEKTGYFPELLMLGIVYLIYFIGFWLTRTASIRSGSLPGFVPGNAAMSLVTVFFNLLYNSIIVNLFPSLAIPCHFGDWVEMGRVTANIPFYSLSATVICVGAGMILLIAVGGWILWRRKKFILFFILTFLLYLYVTNFLTASMARLSLSNLNHILIQFRYQYVPNALLFLMVVAVIGRLLRPGRWGKVIISCLLLPVLIANISLSYRNVATVNRHLDPLRRLITNIRTGIYTGEINEAARLYIQPGITKYLPELCWHKGIGSKMEGTYEWLFPEDKIGCFAFSRRDAVWIMDSPLGDYRRIDRTIKNKKN